MPKNPVTDPITDKEIAFARLLLAGTMNDREAAEAVGINPSNAAYTKSKPRVRAYMLEHRAAVNEKLADDEAEAQRTLNRSRNQGREQILDRLWQLASLNPEQTRGSIAGQIKAMSMILTIEGFTPDRRLSPAQAQPAAPPVTAKIYISEAQRRREQQAEVEQPPEAETAVEEQPVTLVEPERVSPPPPAGDAPSPNLDRSHPDHPIPANPSAYPERTSWLPDVMGLTYDAKLHPSGPFRLSIPAHKAGVARGR